jgi:hypothetical protein
MNGFDVQSDVDAMRERQMEMVSNIEAPAARKLEFPKTPRK